MREKIRISSLLLPKKAWWVQDPENPIWILGGSNLVSSILTESLIFNYMTQFSKEQLSLFGTKGALHMKIKAKLNEENYNKNPKVCLFCGKMIPYKERRKKFCSRSCFITYRNLENSKSKREQYNSKSCLYCGNSLPYTGSYNLDRKFCSKECKLSYHREQYLIQWKEGKVSGLSGKDTHALIKEYIRNKYNNKCAKCNCSLINPYTNKSILEIHHIDGDYTNNQESNLILFCPNCHAMTESYRRNAGKGRNRSKDT